MYTPASFLRLATEAEARYRELLRDFPPGTIHDERNEARRRMEDALACAAWMESQGHTSMANVGPFMATSCAKGQRVRVRRGAHVFGTSLPPSGIELSRAQVVTVAFFDRGYIDPGHHPTKLVQGKVTWAGTGGYWRWTDINNIEPVT